MPKTIYRHPHFKDGLTIYHLIKSCPPLDVNTIYYYYVLCRDFANTSVIAEQNKKIVGFLSAYLKPQAPECLFVWQIAVAESARGQKIASNMLNWIMAQAACRKKVNTLETTISPSNQASQSLFKRFAEHHQASCHTSTFLDISQFGEQAHEAEILFRIQWMR